MRRLIKAILLAFVFLIIATWFARCHFARKADADDLNYHQQVALDASFEKRIRSPREVSLMVITKTGGLIGEANRPSFQKRIRETRKRPVVLDLPGCGFPSWLKGVPDGVAMLSIEENPRLLGHETLTQACSDRDGAAIKAALETQRDMLFDYVRKADWIDRSRIMISGSGEAAPIVAALDGPVKSRVILGDPCLVRWSRITTSSPMLILMTRRPQGLYDRAMLKVSLSAAIAGSPSLPPSLLCPGLPRPKYLVARAVMAPGVILAQDRPQPLMAALKAAYEGL